jgi:hypothetical protein
MAKKARKPPAAAVPAPQRRHFLAAPTRGKGPARTFTSRPVPVEFAAPEHRFVRVDIEISGIFHGEASYEGRIFLNNPKADAETPKDLAHGVPHLRAWRVPGRSTALREIVKSSKTATITVVPVVTAVNELCDAENVFRCENIQFVTYN